MANKMATWLKVVVAVVAIAVVAVLVVGSQGEWFQGKLKGSGVQMRSAETDKLITDRLATDKMAVEKIVTDKIIVEEKAMDRVATDKLVLEIQSGNYDAVASELQLTSVEKARFDYLNPAAKEAVLLSVVNEGVSVENALNEFVVAEEKLGDLGFGERVDLYDIPNFIPSATELIILNDFDGQKFTGNGITPGKDRIVWGGRLSAARGLQNSKIVTLSLDYEGCIEESLKKSFSDTLIKVPTVTPKLYRVDYDRVTGPQYTLLATDEDFDGDFAFVLDVKSGEFADIIVRANTYPDCVFDDTPFDTLSVTLDDFSWFVGQDLYDVPVSGEAQTIIFG